MGKEQLEEEKAEDEKANARRLSGLMEAARAKADEAAERWRTQQEAAKLNEQSDEENGEVEKAKACRLFRLSLRAQEEARAIAEEAAEKWRAHAEANARYEEIIE